MLIAQFVIAMNSARAFQWKSGVEGVTTPNYQTASQRIVKMCVIRASIVPKC